MNNQPTSSRNGTFGQHSAQQTFFTPTESNGSSEPYLQDSHYGPNAYNVEVNDDVAAEYEVDEEGRHASYFPLRRNISSASSRQQGKQPYDNNIPLSPHPPQNPHRDNASGVSDWGNWGGDHRGGPAPYAAGRQSTSQPAFPERVAFSSSENVYYEQPPRQRNRPEMNRAISEANLLAAAADFPQSGSQTTLSDVYYGGAGSAYLDNGAAGVLPNQVEEDRKLAQQIHESERTPTEATASAAAAAAGTTAPPTARPKILQKPKVARQVAKRMATTHRPYFLWIVTAVQIGLVIGGYFINKSFTGSFIETPAANPMIGPTGAVLIHMGARFTPCMRPLPTLQSSLNFQCPNTTTTAICPLEEFCGFGGFRSGRPDQWFRFIVPIFLHGGVVHLLFNMLFQLQTGLEMERDMGSLRLGAIYMISGTAGNVFGANFAPVKLQSTGASGALYGLIGCLLLDLLQNWKLIQNPIRELAKMLILIIISLALGLLPGFDNFAHLFGLLSGFAAGLALLPRIHFGKWDRRVKIGCMVIAIPLIIIVFTLVLINFYKATVPGESCSWCRYLSCIPINGWCDPFDNK